MSDTPKATKVSNLREDLLKEVVFNPGLRPSLRREIVTNFVIQRHRLDTPYLPQDRQDLEDWIKERSVIPIGEWHQLTGLLSFDITSDFFTYIRNETLVVSLDDAHRFEVTLSDSRLDESAQELEILISNWLQYYGPVSPSFVSQCFSEYRNRRPLFAWKASWKPAWQYLANCLKRMRPIFTATQPTMSICYDPAVTVQTGH
ncbi:MAG: hypothetical protein ACNYPE_09350 [Candidatus Azotimanducaceae bacterium WSBS_2022_MAG_OTU7]